MNRAQIKAEKAAKKATDAAVKQAGIQAKSESKVERIKEPDPELTTAEVEVASPSPKVVLPDSNTNTLGAKTRDSLNRIIKASDVCLNTNTEANIQDQICSIIRTSLRAYELHTGQLFDTDLG